MVTYNREVIYHFLYFEVAVGDEDKIHIKIRTADQYHILMKFTLV